MDEPFPDVHELFRLYSAIYFSQPTGCLDRCMVEWSSKRMTLCGGTCQYLGSTGGCIIKLSEPLLKFRPVKDLKETLLHEMIHAYMFLTGTRGTGSDGHGPPFVAKMNKVNSSTAYDPMRPPEGYNIDVHHTWSAEVESYRTHHWKCERCGDLVKRAMNRPPQEADCRGRQGRGADCADPHCRYHVHQKTCGGTYVKIAEPEGFGSKNAKAAEKKRTAPAAEPLNSIKKFLKPANAASTSAEPPAIATKSAGELLSTNAAIQPNQDSMRKLLADAAMRRIQRLPTTASGSSRQTAHDQSFSVDAAQPRAGDTEVIVVSDSDPE